MVKKLAIFAEGYTEIVLLERLLIQIAGSHNLVIEKISIQGGSKAPRIVKMIQVAKAITTEKYFVLLVDCSGDNQVRTRIHEEHENLTKAGYSEIIGIRDVRPDFKHSDIPRLEMGLRTRIKTSLIPVEFILTIMEVEAWFLAEFKHFPVIDPAITVDAIRNSLGFDPENGDMSAQLEPANDLNNSYKLGGKLYEKSNALITVNALDIEHIYLELPQKINYLNRLIARIDHFFT